MCRGNASSVDGLLAQSRHNVRGKREFIISCRVYDIYVATGRMSATIMLVVSSNQITCMASSRSWRTAICEWIESAASGGHAVVKC